MRKVILQEFVSLDGFAAGPNESVDFVPASTSDDPSLERHQLQLARTVDLILLGRVTYQMFVEYWPGKTRDEDPAADIMNHTPTVVFSKTLNRAPWGKYVDATIVKDDPAATVTRLRQEPGQDMVVWGSLTVARALLKAGLVDRCELVICPVVLGKGTPLFHETVKEFKPSLKATTAFDRGAVALSYES